MYAPENCAYVKIVRGVGAPVEGEGVSKVETGKRDDGR